VARTTQLAAVLWMSTTGWLSGCGRLWFDTSSDRSPGGLPDAPLGEDASSGPVDAAIDGPAIDATAGPAPRLDVVAMLSMDAVCGAAAETTMLTVTNSGTADLTISDASVTGDAFRVTVMPTLIPAGMSANFGIEAPMAVVGTDLGGSLKRATLKIESNARIAMVDLEALVKGANIVVTPPSPLDYTGTSGTCPAAKPFGVMNTGNMTIEVIPEAESPFAFDQSSSVDTFLDPGESLFLDVRPVTTQCSGSGNVGFTISSGTICHADPPLQVNLDIQGSSSCFCS
jgi:hypothetical protein